MSEVPPPLLPSESAPPEMPAWQAGGPPIPAIAYSLPSTPSPGAKPGAVTALGVVSAVVALLSAAGSALTAVAALAFFAGGHAMSSRAAQTISLNNSPLFAPEPVRKPVEVGADGIDAVRRRPLVEAFESLHPLRPPRVEQLDVLLARSGRTVLLTAAERKTGREPAPASVREVVLDHGELFSGSRTPAPDFFKLRTGRLELYDDRAVFYPADGSATVRSSLAPVVARRTLPEAEVSTIIERAKELSRDPLTDGQVSALTAVLSAPEQKLVGPAVSGVPAEPAAVTPGARGAVSFRFSQGLLHLGPEGEVLGAAPPPAPPAVPSTAGFVTVVTASVVGFALAVLLFVAAVQTLRGLPSGRRLHQVWAWLKIPVTLIAALTFWWMTARFYDRFAAYGVPQPLVPVGRARAGFMPQPWQPFAAGLVALVYPVVVLIALRARSVREYFQPTH
jgi:hypothetical protein